MLITTSDLSPFASYFCYKLMCLSRFLTIPTSSSLLKTSTGPCSFSSAFTLNTESSKLPPHRHTTTEHRFLQACSTPSTAYCPCESVITRASAQKTSSGSTLPTSYCNQDCHDSWLGEPHRFHPSHHAVLPEIIYSVATISNIAL